MNCKVTTTRAILFCQTKTNRIFTAQNKLISKGKKNAQFSNKLNELSSAKKIKML